MEGKRYDGIELHAELLKRRLATDARGAYENLDLPASLNRFADLVAREFAAKYPGAVLRIYWVEGDRKPADAKVLISDTYGASQRRDLADEMIEALGEVEGSVFSRWEWVVAKKLP
jgi:hypothetical protein